MFAMTFFLVFVFVFVFVANPICIFVANPCISPVFIKCIHFQVKELVIKLLYSWQRSMRHVEKFKEVSFRVFTAVAK